MRLDHIAYRVKDRHKAAKFLIDALGYSISNEFDLVFDDGSKTDCLVLTPSEKPDFETHEIFISDGTTDSIVGKWVTSRDGVGGVHHMAYQVSSVETTMKEWREKGWAEFTTEEPIKCLGLVQCFTRPSDVLGVIIELIQREKDGFCASNIKELMKSTL